jgi:protein TonB
MKSIFAVLFTTLLAFSLNAQQPIRIGGNVMSANLVKKVAPAYPPDMKAQRLEATVVLQMTISTEGVPTSFNNQSAEVNQQFVDAAIEAVKEWRYKPTLLNGEPVEVLTTVTVNFTLSQ